MTTFQWVGLAFICTMFFGSIGIGLWLRHDDERRVAMQQEEGHRLRRERVVEEDDADLFQAFLNQYHAEVELITRTYHGIAIDQGEEAAERWFEEQLGRKPPTSGLDRGR